MIQPLSLAEKRHYLICTRITELEESITKCFNCIYADSLQVIFKKHNILPTISHVDFSIWIPNTGLAAAKIYNLVKLFVFEKVVLLIFNLDQPNLIL